MTDHPLKLSPDKSLMLRGLAILAVLGIHLLAYLKNVYASPQVMGFVALDQVGRFCVPLFVILSGYGLAQRYGDHAVSLATFYRRRVLKLLPPYLLWSVVSYLLFLWIPPWRSYRPTGAFISELLLGQVDYQLYFMVLIFQLYLLFPLLLKLVKKWPTLILMTTAGVQLVLYLWYAGVFGTLPKWFTIDSNQYVFFASWVAYFVLGIWLSRKVVPHWLIKAMPWLAGAAFVVAVLSATRAIQTGTDPLLALRTTRWPIFLYATTFFVTVVTFKRSLTGRSVPSRLNQLLSWLGKKSYLIFLAHTIALRIIFDALAQSRDAVTLVLAAAIWALTVYLTQRYLLADSS